MCGDEIERRFSCFNLILESLVIESSNFPAGLSRSDLVSISFLRVLLLRAARVIRLQISHWRFNLILESLVIEREIQSILEAEGGRFQSHS